MRAIGNERGGHDARATSDMRSAPAEIDEYAERVLQAVIDRNCPPNIPLPGKTVHAIEKTDTFGPGQSLQGFLIVEEADGSLHKMTGKELAAFGVLNPRFIAKWDIEE